MSVTVVLTASIVLQLFAALYALSLIRLTGLRSPWLLLSAAMVLQAFRRYITLKLWFDLGQVGEGFLGQGVVSLLIAILMLIAVILIRPLFEEIVNRRKDAEKVAARFKAMFSDHGAVMLLIDAETDRIVEANKGAARFYGFPEGELVGRRVHDFAATEDRSDRVATIPSHQLTAAGESIVEAQCTDLVLDGRRYICAVLTDVTARVIAERRFAEAAEELESLVEELQESNALLEELNNELHDRDTMRLRFLGTMSHELRTPLAAIVGFSDMLRSGLAGGLNTEQSKQISLIGESGRHILHIVEEMLDIARIDSGHMELEHEAYALDEVVERVVSLLQPSLPDDEVDLRVEGIEAAGTVVGDRHRAEQVLLNVIGNAVKYTQSGHIDVKVRRDARRVVIDVADTGPGIPEGEHEHVFEDYYRVKSGDPLTTKGAGLGLAVSRRLARLMGGDITLESGSGAGSTFTIVLPVR